MKSFKEHGFNEKADVRKALKKVKGLTKDQLAVLAGMNPSVLQVVINQLATLTMGEDLDEALKASDEKYLQARVKMLDALTDKLIRMRVDRTAWKKVQDAKFALEDIIEENNESVNEALVASDRNILTAIFNKLEDYFAKGMQDGDERKLMQLNQFAKLVRMGITKQKQAKGKTFLYKLKK